MPPLFPTYYSTDVRLGYPEPSRNVRLCGTVSVRASNLLNIFIGQFFVEHLALRLPSLGDLVGVVVGIGSKKKMGWIYASRIVAGMQHVSTLRDKSDVQPIREPMSQITSKTPVTRRIDVSIPKNTTIFGFFADALVKAVRQLSLFSTLPLTGSRTKNPLGLLAGGGIERERATALLADTRLYGVKASHGAMLPKKGRVVQ